MPPGQSALTEAAREAAWMWFKLTGDAMVDRIVSSSTHDAHMSVKSHIADGWVASVYIVAKGASKGTDLVKVDTLFEREEVAWEYVETLARAELSNLK
jgi:hypothetical protein